MATWIGAPENKIITGEDINAGIAQGVFTGTFTNTTKAVTKSELAASNISFLTTTASYVAKSSNQLLAKRDVKFPLRQCIMIDVYTGNAYSIGKECALEIGASSPNNSISSYVGQGVAKFSSIEVPNTASVQDCYICCARSDVYNSPLFFMRFAINTKKLKADFPSETKFTFYINQSGYYSNIDYPLPDSRYADILHSKKTQDLIDLPPSTQTIYFGIATPETDTNIRDTWLAKTYAPYNMDRIARIDYYPETESYVFTRNTAF